MALYFLINDGHEIEWHVNAGVPEKKPEIWQYKDADGPGPQKATGQLREVVGVQADGHELEYLKLIFNGLPTKSDKHPNRRIERWRGDLARFIYDNL